MSTSLLSERRFTSSSHPPDTDGVRTLVIPDPAFARRLALSDRLSLRLGLWLLQRSQRTARPLPADRAGLYRPVSEREAITLLTYDLQRGLR